MNTLTITDLEVFFRIGVTEEERAHPQRLLLTLEMEDTFEQATTSDDLRDTIDYAALSDHLRGLGRDRQWKLIERLAAEIAGDILTRHQPRAVTVTVKKFVISQARHVSFTLRRTREEPACVTPAAQP